MRLIEILKIVFINLFQNKAKVLLTSLGIIVGTVTIVMVIAIGRGGEEDVMSQFRGLSAETIYVNPNYDMGIGVNKKDIPKLTPEIMNQIFDESTTLSGIYIRASNYNVQTVIGNQKQNIPIVGVTELYSTVSNFNLIHGRDFTVQDMQGKSRSAVIGHGVAEKYFMKAEDAINAKIKIGNQEYRVIGVLDRTGDGLQGITPDDSIFLPYSTAMMNIFDEETMPQIVALANNLKLVEKAKFEIKDTLHYVLEDGDVYKITDAGSRIEAAMKSARTMNVLLMSVATIVFIVGGIGIMNVLFVSVKERTKEIGILKALGGTKKDIMLQFLLEAVIIAIFGGIVGVFIGIYLMPFMEYTKITVSPSITGNIIAILFAIGTGTVFGLYPAYKATCLKPVEALSYE